MFYSRLGAPGFEALEFGSGGNSTGVSVGGVRPNDTFVSSTAVGDSFLRGGGGSRSGSVASAVSVSTTGAGVPSSIPESRTSMDRAPSPNPKSTLAKSPNAP
jgi:hypothetical protein